VAVYLLLQNDVIVIRNPVVVRERPTVTFVMGTAERRPAGESVWEALEASATLRSGDTLRTGPDGAVDLRFGGGTVVRMGENAVLGINENTLRRLVLHAERGTIFSRLRRAVRRQDIELHSSSTTLAVRGTDVVFSVSDARTRVFTLTGVVEVYSRDRPDAAVLVVAQHETGVTAANAAPTPPTRMDQETTRRFQQTIDSIHEDVVLDISNEIHFAPNTAEILPASRDELERVRRRIQQADGPIVIVGHTARVGDPSAMYALSLERAEAVKRRLVETGVRAGRLAVRGYGAERPVATNETPEGRAANRRVEFIVQDQ
jgi:outer membrane protein OmpA-like peptidoglycan-associated protein